MSSNSMVKKLKICYYHDTVALNLKYESSLNSIQFNTSITDLNFGRVSFTENEIKMFDEAMKENQTIQILDLSSSNYSGNFGFLSLFLDAGPTK